MWSGEIVQRDGIMQIGNQTPIASQGIDGSNKTGFGRIIQAVKNFFSSILSKITGKPLENRTAESTDVKGPATPTDSKHAAETSQLSNDSKPTEMAPATNPSPNNASAKLSSESAINPATTQEAEVNPANPQAKVATPENLQFQKTQEIVAFDDLNICQTPEQKATLNALISQLQAKSPQMLAGIFDNCQWLKGRADDSFIYSVAVASIQMELANIFDQAGFDKLSNGTRPTAEIMAGTECCYKKPLLDGASEKVLKKTRENFSSMLDGMPKPPGVESFRRKTTNADMNSFAWRGWEMGAMGTVRSCVNSDILPKNRTDQAAPADMESLGLEGMDEKGRADLLQSIATEKAVVSHFLPQEYAYSQLLFRHMTFPGQEEGPPPALLAIRKVDAFAYGKITGETVEEGTPSAAKNLTYGAEKALPAESWSVVSAVRGPDPIYGDSAIYGKVPIYSVLTSVFSQSWCPGQKELVVAPFSDISITAEAQFNEVEYEEKTVLPAMERQYGVDNTSIVQVRQRLKRNNQQ
ncbi:MAG: hypothetical protein LBJ75_03240 [Puniceicoccales bacterium]|jgi:hypothetical protein|nr:hypothetical protein [Puniceicoccales bacterium]